MQNGLSIVILAAGLGTRMRSKLAKVLHRAGGACLLEHVVRAARRVAAPAQITAVVGHQAEQVRAEVAAHGIGFVLQTEQKGTGHALRICEGQVGLSEGRVVVLYGDCPLLSAATIERLLQAHEELGQAATVITTHLAHPAGYGRIVRDEPGRVAAIVEEKAANAEQKRITEINSGIYCFEASVLWPYLAKVTPNRASGEFYLTDVVELMRAEGYYTAPLVVDDSTELMGINTKVELAAVDKILRSRKVFQLMLAGVTVERPETVTVDLDVEAEQDSVLEAFVQLRGRTKIGEGSVVGACSILSNALVGANVKIFPFTTIADSELRDGAEVGPYARLRMGALMAEGSHVGNFVELKNTKLGRGSKAMHLAYLGDSEIGAKVNIGAGTITCNYDGRKKHKTIIGDGAFVGSNSTLVAPADIGAGSYVAAGSVVTRPVPADALGIGRGHQVNKEGWAAARRAKQ